MSSTLGCDEQDRLPSPWGEPAAEGCTVEEALLTRHSVRAFLPRPVPREQVERLLSLASRSASNSNIQPWHVHVLTGESKQRLSAAILEALVTEGRLECDYPYQPEPNSWLEPFKTRRRAFGEQLYGETLGIPATDTETREHYRRRNYDFFGAPVGMILTVSRHPQHSALIDAGLFLQALMLSARSLGLDSCAQASFLDFSPVLRRELDIPDDHMVICGMALGHADPTHPLSRQLTSREPVESVATFH